MGELDNFKILEERELTLFSDIYTFEELKRIDMWGAFLPYLSVKQAKLDGIIPEGFEDISPDYCDCGAERMCTYTLTEITCVNPRCPIKRAYSLEKIFKNFGVDGIGYATCNKILELQSGLSKSGTLFDIISNTEFDEDEYGEATYDKIMRGIGTIERSRVTFQELLKLVGIPGVEEKASQLFAKYSDIGEVLDDFDKYGLVNFYSVNGTESEMIMFKVSSYMQEIMSAYEVLCTKGSLLQFSGDTLDIVMTNSIDGFSSKPKYIEFLNSILTLPNGYRLMTIKNGKGRETTDYFVIDDFSRITETIRRAKEREVEEDRKLIYSSDEFSALMYAYRLQFTEEAPDGH